MQTKNIQRGIIAILSALTLAGMALRAQSPGPTIAISKTAAESNYVKWLRNAHAGVLYINMYNVPFDSLEVVMSKCSGLLLTGGSDVAPAIYGKGTERKKCEDIDVKRDSLELKLIRYARKNGMPILGVCRGEQILNVANGGTLTTDIPSYIGKQVTHRNDTMAWHRVSLSEGSLLSKLCGINEGMVNSSHHQCVDRLARNLVATAMANDGVVEAFESPDSEKGAFMLGVQWHPERMPAGSPLSGPLAKYFIKKSLEYSAGHR